MERTDLPASSGPPLAMAPARGRFACGPWAKALLLAILLLAGVLRFGGITRVGIVGEDEAWYTSDARLWHRGAVLLFDPQGIRAALDGDKQAYQQRLETIGVDFGGRYHKPTQGYTFLGALMMFIIGDRPAALLFTSALFGTAAVLVLYSLGMVLFDRTVALCAAFFLAVSPYHLIFSRSAMTEATSGFFILAGILLWACGISRGWSRRRTYGLCGLALGYASLCHFRSLYIPFVLILFDLLSVRDEGVPRITSSAGRSGAVRRLGWFCAGLAAPVAAVESVFLAVRLVAVITDSYLPVRTFLEGGYFWWETVLRGGVWVEGDSVINWQVIPSYGRLFLDWHGWAASLAAVLGLIVVARRKGVARIPFVMVLATLGYLMLQRWIVARGISAAYPLLCLCVAVGLCWVVNALVLSRWKRLAPVFALVVALLVAGPAFAVSRHLFTNKRGDVAGLCAFLAEQGTGTVVTMNPMKFRLYLERSGMPVVAAHRILRHSQWRPEGTASETLARLRASGARWIITEPRTWFQTPDKPWIRWWEHLRAELESDAVLAAEFPHVRGYRRELLAQAMRLDRLPDMIRQDGGPLRVYDLQAPAPIAGPGTLSPVASRRAHD